MEPRQAGQAVRCACGNSVTVPTLLEMAKLERAEAIAVPEAQRHPPLWGISQRLVVLGAVIILLGVLMAVLAVRTRPEPPPPDFTPELVQRWPAIVCLGEFQHLRREGLERGIVAADDARNQKLFAYHACWWGAMVLGLVGSGLIAAGVAYRRPVSRQNGGRH